MLKKNVLATGYSGPIRNWFHKLDDHRPTSVFSIAWFYPIFTAVSDLQLVTMKDLNLAKSCH